MIKTIGNTPLIKIKYEYEGKTNYIYTKLESYNLTGSIKDRPAYYIITKAEEREGDADVKSKTLPIKRAGKTRNSFGNSRRSDG